jgi:hypothetical protein
VNERISSFCSGSGMSAFTHWSITPPGRNERRASRKYSTEYRLVLPAWDGNMASAVMTS